MKMEAPSPNILFVAAAMNPTAYGPTGVYKVAICEASRNSEFIGYCGLMMNKMPRKPTNQILSESQRERDGGD